VSSDLGYANLAHTVPLWQQVRPDFPVTERLIYLNHAAVAPLVRPASDRMRWLAEDACLHGSLHFDEWLAAYESLRTAAAQLIGAHRDEIALVKNTSEGISTVALGLDWKPGDRIVAFREEFPANMYPWQRLAPRGVGIDWLSIYDPLDAIDRAARGAKLLAISYVNYLSGHRVDLNAIGEICHRHGVFFFVDAIQGLGVFPLDVQKSHIGALAADGHKWLLGPEGCGILYLRREWLDRIEPVEFGWTNVAGFNDYSSRDMTLRADAGALQVIFNAYWEPLAFDLAAPDVDVLGWRRVVDTSLASPDDVAFDWDSAAEVAGTNYVAAARSVVVLAARRSPDASSRRRTK